MSNFPKITVLLPVYNAECFIAEAIQSILKQTFRDFELLIINDASTDGSEKIIRTFSDPRIRHINNEFNLNLAKTLNKGIELAKGEYIARMDQDDICFCDRLEKQFDFLEKNPDIGLCGTQIDIFGKGASDWKLPHGTEEIETALFWGNVIAHPTVMFRKDLFKKYGLYYNHDRLNAEDYDLWVRAARHFKLANLNDVLLKYRWHEGQMSQKNYKDQMQAIKKIMISQVESLGINPTDREAELHFAICTGKTKADKSFVKEAHEWLYKLKSFNEVRKLYPEHYFSKKIAEHWFEVCFGAEELGSWIYRKLILSPINRGIEIEWRYKRRFIQILNNERNSYTKNLEKTVNNIYQSMKFKTRFGKDKRFIILVGKV